MIRWEKQCCGSTTKFCFYDDVTGLAKFVMLKVWTRLCVYVYIGLLVYICTPLFEKCGELIPGFAWGGNGRAAAAIAAIETK